MSDRPEPVQDESGQWWSGKRRICGGKRKEARGGGRCHEAAGHGTDHPGHGSCNNHLGSTPMVARGAYRQIAYAMGGPLEGTAPQHMADTIRTTAGHVAWLESKVGEFRFPSIAKIDGEGVDVEQYMSPNQESWWKIYTEERDRLMRYCEIALRAGLAERTVRLAEDQGKQMAVVVDRILTGLQLQDWQLLLVPEVVPAALRSIVLEGETV